MPTAWRFVKERYAAGAFTGEGARLNAGRWNSPGVRMVYCSSSIALSVLELLVHLQQPRVLASYVLFSAAIEGEMIEQLTPDELPRNWRDFPAPPALASIGDRWAYELRSAVLTVPSAIVEAEYNYLLNPLHPQFSSIVVSGPLPYRLDPRLAGG